MRRAANPSSTTPIVSRTKLASSSTPGTPTLELMSENIAATSMAREAVNRVDESASSPTYSDHIQSSHSNKRKRTQEVIEDARCEEQDSIAAPPSPKRKCVVTISDEDAIALGDPGKNPHRRQQKTTTITSRSRKNQAFCQNTKLAKSMKQFKNTEVLRPRPTTQATLMRQTVGVLPNTAINPYVPHYYRRQPIDEKKVGPSVAKVEVEGNITTYIKSKTALTFSDGEGGFKQIKTVLKGGKVLYPNITITETEDGKSWKIVTEKMTVEEKKALSAGYLEKEKLERKQKLAEERQAEKEAKNLLCYGTTKPKSGRRPRKSSSSGSSADLAPKRGARAAATKAADKTAGKTGGKEVETKTGTKAAAAGVTKSTGARRSGRGVAMKVTAK